MGIRALGRYGLIMVCAVLAGCSSLARPEPALTPAQASSECRWNRSKCLYDGQYEPGERDYAEQEARRLNLAEAARLRRAFGN
ncbi:hypothetical protein [Bordetella genomosp. 12]|uniref:Lipoprotein n=1 Tax=Bordetella genomosp. 12 TaxID=463035 RepID=A0A261VJX8_9BORD|nr:hypothetical protein [Bordetella genomosp. 12]OZI74031.1 hypothetical protein CAL22_05895 [Bordetella genomosp. 12]